MGVRRADRQGSDRRFSTDTTILSKKDAGPKMKHHLGMWEILSSQCS